MIALQFAFLSVDQQLKIGGYIIGVDAPYLHLSDLRDADHLIVNNICPSTVRLSDNRCFAKPMSRSRASG
ncbi:MAG: hypothetical protein J7463_14450 [Roseiflexus sp.]|nr:hypothetical protein [Roseiflexus sp.]